MPLTLKLSQQFYNKLGDEVANELVGVLNTADEAYRSELYRVNELNFVRFDARLEQRLAEFRAEVLGRISAFESRIERRIGDFEAKIEQRITAFESRIERRIGDLEAKIEVKIETRLARTERRMLRWMFTFWTGQLLALAGLLFLFLRR
ncbi:MAG: hypothetical protein ACREL5_09300 [Gemmatimonadales bacterium]